MICPQAMWLRLMRDGRLRCDGRRIPGLQHFRPAYRWMAAELSRRVAPAPRGVSYPLWAYVQWRGERHPTPDLRAIRHSTVPGRHLRLSFELPRNQLLISEIGDWCQILNGWPLRRTPSDERKFDDAALEANSWCREELLASWDALFDLGAPRHPDWCDPVSESALQACFWQLPLSAVCNVDIFDGASRG